MNLPIRQRPRPNLPLTLLRKLEIAFSNGNLEEAYYHVRAAFEENTPKQIGWSTNIVDLFSARQVSILNRIGIVQLKDFLAFNQESLLSQKQFGQRMLQKLRSTLNDVVKEHRLTLPPQCLRGGTCDLFEDDFDCSEPSSTMQATTEANTTFKHDRPVKTVVNDD